MKLLVVGGGGREHTIIRYLKKNPQVETIFACPGNGGMAEEAVCTGIGATDIEGIKKFANDMYQQKGWDVAVSKGYGSHGDEYSVPVRRSSLR